MIRSPFQKDAAFIRTPVAFEHGQPQHKLNESITSAVYVEIFQNRQAIVNADTP